MNFCIVTLTENSCRRLKVCSSITESLPSTDRSFNTFNGIDSFC